MLDTNVLKESTRANPHEHVSAWLKTVDDSDLAISVISVREIWRGIEKKRREDAKLAELIEAGAKEIFAAFEGRIIPITEQIAELWGRLLGGANKHVDDTGLAATARVLLISAEN